jgi:hypothetical protein
VNSLSLNSGGTINLSCFFVNQRLGQVALAGARINTPMININSEGGLYGHGTINGSVKLGGTLRVDGQLDIAGDLSGENGVV